MVPAGFQRVLLHNIWNSLVDSQQGEGERKNTDVHLICADGLVPAHTAILASVSPLLKQLFNSQGPDYFGCRSILLPEHPVTEIERMIQLIYNGSVKVASEADANKLRLVLEELQISNTDKLTYEKQTRRESTHVLYYVYNPERAAALAKSKLEKAMNSKVEASTSIDVATNAASTDVDATVPLPAEPLTNNGTANGGRPSEPEVRNVHESDDDIIEVEVIRIVDKPVIEVELVEPVTVPVVDMDQQPESTAVADTVVATGTDSNETTEPDRKAEDDAEDSRANSDAEPETETETEPAKEIPESESHYSESQPQAVPSKRGRARRFQRKRNKDMATASGTDSPSPPAPPKKGRQVTKASTPGSVNSESSSTAKSTRSTSRTPRSISTDSSSTTKRTRSSSANKSSASDKQNSSLLAVSRNETPSPSKSLRSATKSTQPVETGSSASTASKELTVSASKSSRNTPVRTLRSRENRKRILESSDEEVGGGASKSRDSSYDSESPTPTIPRKPGRGRPKGMHIKKKSARPSGRHGQVISRSSPIPKSPAVVIERSIRQQQNDPGSESECDDLEPEFYKDSKRVFLEAKLCRGCGTRYSNPREASDCVTEKHKLVRCYFCFQVFKNTELLFRHYATRHRKAGRENNLICPYCQSSVPHRSISTHVISNHIFDSTTKALGAAPANKAGNQSSAKTKPKPPPVKKNRIGGMQLMREEKPGQNVESEPEDDDLISGENSLVMKKKSNDGKVQVFVLDKDKNKK